MLRSFAFAKQQPRYNHVHTEQARVLLLTRAKDMQDNLAIGPFISPCALCQLATPIGS